MDTETEIEYLEAIKQVGEIQERVETLKSLLKLLDRKECIDEVLNRLENVESDIHNEVKKHERLAVELVRLSTGQLALVGNPVRKKLKKGEQ
ncbi:MAG: hypothetical protein LBC07_04255 [Elusimicrobiota bacterium]|nr:hypothetical protein [Elusimicrobiota bacterium]